MSDNEDSFDEEEDDYGILKKALHVELPENFNPNKIPQTGEEYLQHVVYERTKCKTWVTANIDRNKFKNQQTFKLELDKSVKEAPQSLLPSREWQTQKIEDFTNFRNFIRMKMSKESSVASFHEESFLSRVKSETPQFSEMTQYTQAAKIRMLQIISKHLDSIPAGSSVGETMGAWLYAILSLLEKPLSPDSCHNLREFAKRCLLLRSNLSGETSADLYTPLNLFICIVSRFYNQLDLADP
ncbi:hypothetical protein MTP99_016674 [Tenebrio molitor]|nr:hypothetical protein MTP99_016674 [Tenebrio molitor]